MRAVAVVDPSTTILGIRTPLPVFVSPAAMAGLGHPEGECNITRGAGAMGIIQGVRPFTSPSVRGVDSKNVGVRTCLEKYRRYRSGTKGGAGSILPGAFTLCLHHAQKQ